MRWVSDSLEKVEGSVCDMGYGSKDCTIENQEEDRHVRAVKWHKEEERLYFVVSSVITSLYYHSNTFKNRPLSGRNPGFVK